MNLILSHSAATDLKLAQEGHTFIGSADDNGEVHVFLRAGHELVSVIPPKPKQVDYVRIRITGSTAGMAFPYGQLSAENSSFIKDFIGEEFTAVRANMNYYRLKNGYLVHIYNAFEIPKA